MNDMITPWIREVAQNIKDSSKKLETAKTFLWLTGIFLLLPNNKS